MAVDKIYPVVGRVQALLFSTVNSVLLAYVLLGMHNIMPFKDNYHSLAYFKNLLLCNVDIVFSIHPIIISTLSNKVFSELLHALGIIAAKWGT